MYTAAGGDDGIDHNKNPLRFPYVLNFCDPMISTRTRIPRSAGGRARPQRTVPDPDLFKQALPRHIPPAVRGQHVAAPIDTPRTARVARTHRDDMVRQPVYVQHR
jgi:hypothetical protein